MAAIAVEGATVAVAGRPVLADVHLRVGSGERMGLLGRSGSGKSALLRVMAGLERPLRGSVTVDGRPVADRDARIAMVFPADSVYPHLDVAGNLAFPLALEKGEKGRRIGEVAEWFRLLDVMGRSPTTLSAGQRGVVAAARALVRPDVTVVLFDDPGEGGSPDPLRRLMQADSRPTVVFATRDGREVLRWADRVAVLAEGRVGQVGTPVEVYRCPASLEVAEIVGELNRIPATVDGRGLAVGVSRIASDALPVGLTNGTRVVLGIRPGDLRPASPGTPFLFRLRGTVGRVEQAGPAQRVLFGLGRQRGTGFCGLVPARYPVAAGDRMDWALDPHTLRIYDPVTGRAW